MQPPEALPPGTTMLLWNPDPTALHNDGMSMHQTCALD